MVVNQSAYFYTVKTEQEILDAISLGEDSSRQFKLKFDKAPKLAEEMCAFSNSGGGIIYVGVDDNNTIVGLSEEEQRRINQWVGSASNELIRPSIYPITQSIKIDGKLLLLINIPEGTTKPYCTSDGFYFVKSGSDKRKASPQELLRLFQESSQINLDETLTSSSIDNIDLAKFYTFFEANFGQEVSATGLTLEQVLNNMNIAREGHFTLGGLLLFGNNVQGIKPYCIIRAVAYAGNEISDNQYNDKRDCIGSLDEQFRTAMIFLKNNLSRIQSEQSFNSAAVLEIDERALEEAVVNALLHRDYSKNAVIRLLIFKDRIEIISPGSLPNHLNVENIKNGNSVMRNPLLCSFGTKILPYSGIGSGVPRIVKNHPATELIDDKNGEQFTIILKRPVKQ